VTDYWQDQRAADIQFRIEREQQMTAAKTPAKAAEFVEGADVTEVPDGWEWETTREEVPTGVQFTEKGESFVGLFVEKRHVDREPAADGSDQSFDLYVFTGRDGQPYSIANSYALDEAYGIGGMPEGKWMRIEYVKDVKTARGLNDMKDFRIQVRK
jgi:hypothetical protein